MADENKEQAAVYVAWGTLKNALDALAQGVPNQIDRTAFPGLSGGVQSQLLAGLKFLGLITNDGRPTPTLNAVAVTDEVARKEKLKAILRDKYSELFALDLLKTTPAELNDRMRDRYNVSGDTLDKAVRFFLAALDYVEIPVSRLFKRSAGNGPTLVRRRRSPRPKGTPENPDDIVPTVPTGTARSVTLKSGGTLTVSASLDVFKLSAEDRTFVFGLIDKLEDYQKQNPS